PGPRARGPRAHGRAGAAVGRGAREPPGHGPRVRRGLRRRARRRRAARAERVSGVVAAVALAAGVAAAWLLYALARRRVFIWLPAYLRRLARPRPPHAGPLHVMFCFVDHFEPGWGGAD